MDREISGQPMPGTINPRVLKQNVWWFDVRGEAHKIAEMEREYVLNVLCFGYTHPALRDGFNWSPLQRALYERLKEACELADRYEGLE
jgi:hypothetical protein